MLGTIVPDVALAAVALRRSHPELRVLGVRRPRDEVRAALPVRGVLSLTSARPGRYAGQKNPPLLAGLANAERAAPWLLQPLDQACVRVIRGGNVVVAGLQDAVLRGRVQEVYRQAWLVPAGERTGGRCSWAPDDPPLPERRTVVNRATRVYVESKLKTPWEDGTTYLFTGLGVTPLWRARR